MLNVKKGTIAETRYRISHLMNGREKLFHIWTKLIRILGLNEVTNQDKLIVVKFEQALLLK